MEYTLDHITKEDGKWFAEVRKHNANGTSVREHTGDLWGWNGMTYNSLKCMLSENYNIELPPIKELQLIKRTSCRKIYSIKQE